MLIIWFEFREKINYVIKHVQSVIKHVKSLIDAL